MQQTPEMLIQNKINPYGKYGRLMKIVWLITNIFIINSLSSDFTKFKTEV